MSISRWPPASFFGMNLGLTALCFSWRLAEGLWPLPKWISEAILIVDAVIWAVLILLFLGKAIWARIQLVNEFYHPIQCCFIGLIPTSTMLLASASKPYTDLAIYLFWLGLAGQIIFGVYRTGTMWMGDRDQKDTTPVAYLPTVAGGFVAAAASNNFGYHELGQFIFGVGLFTGLAYESVILRRLMETPSLAVALRPTLGIFFAPPVVGCAAYLSLTSGPPDIVAKAMLGYGIFQGLVLLRLLPWLKEQSFAPSYWAYTFATGALTICMLEFVKRGASGAFEWITVAVFVAENVIIGGIFVGTLVLALTGKLLPPAPASK